MNTTPRKFYAADIPASGQPDKKLSIYKDGFIYEGYYTSGISHSFDLKIICLDHCFKDGQNVTGLYTKKYEVDISAGNGEWESVSAEYFNTCKDEYRRVIAIPTPYKKMTPMEELIEQLKKLSPESPMGNDVSKAFHGGIQLAILKAKFLLEAEREYASQQAPAMYTREQVETAFDAGCDFEYSRHFHSVPNRHPDKQQFIQSLK